jgi:hypothetical protein
LSFGPDEGPQVLVVPPLFEELNRTRKMITDTMRALAESGIGAHLPDLPGTGESPTELGEIGLAGWKEALAGAAQSCSPDLIFSIRGGCLLDQDLASEKILRFSPVSGKAVVRDLIRARSVTDAGFDKDAQAAVFSDGPTMLGGYLLTAPLASELNEAEPGPADGLKVVKRENEPGDSDFRISGPPLWRRAEPSGSPEQSAGLAAIISGLLS